MTQSIAKPTSKSMGLILSAPKNSGVMQIGLSLWRDFQVFQANDWSRGARPPRAHTHAPRGVTSKMRPKASGIPCVGREAHPTAPEASAIPEKMLL